MKFLKFLLPTLFTLSLVFGPSLISLSTTGGSIVSAASPIDEGLTKIQNNFPTTGKITGSRTVGDLISNVIYVLLTITMALAVLFIIIGGFQYITSAGNEGRAESGKKTLVNALIGLVLIIMSYVIVRVINETLARR